MIDCDFYHCYVQWIREDNEVQWTKRFTEVNYDQSDKKDHWMNWFNDFIEWNDDRRVESVQHWSFQYLLKRWTLLFDNDFSENKRSFWMNFDNESIDIKKL